MNLGRTFATTGRILAQIRHDPRTIGLLLVVPSLLIGLMSWLFADTTVFDTRSGDARAVPLYCHVPDHEHLDAARAQIGNAREAPHPADLQARLHPRLRARLRAARDPAGGRCRGFSVWVCGLQIEGSVWLLLAVALADAVLGTTLGLLASAFARTEFQVVQFMPRWSFPRCCWAASCCLGDHMPDVLYSICDWLPLSHAIDALNALSTGSEDDAYVGGKLLIIAAFAVGAILLGALTLRRRTQ